MKPQIAIYDACVLYPAPLRDTLVQLAFSGLVLARWTDTIHEEWISNLLDDRPDLTRDPLERTGDKMNLVIEDSLVSGHESLIDGLELPDPGDRHVLAAAIHCEAQVIVTTNTKDFPNSVLGQYDIEKRRPDAFIAELFSVEPLRVLQALKAQRERLRNPAQDQDSFLATLQRQGLSTTVSLLTPWKTML